MVLFWRSFIATLFLCGVLVTGAEGCSDLMATVDCATNYANSVTNLTTPQLMNMTLQCQLIDTMKSCLVSACGSWEAVSQEFKEQVQNAETTMKCGSLDESCKNVMATLDCVNNLQQEMNTTANIYATPDKACQVLGQFKTCVADACGGLERVPQEVRASLDAGKEHGLDCGEGGSAWTPVAHTAAVWMLTILSVFVWMS